MTRVAPAQRAGGRGNVPQCAPRDDAIDAARCSASDGAVKPVQVFVTPGIHGTLVMQAALQRQVIDAWQQGMAYYSEPGD